MPNTSQCYVCDADEPRNYTVGSKRVRLLTWMHYHAANNIEHLGTWRYDRASGTDAEGKFRLSKTIGWDIREDHTLMNDLRNEYGTVISMREFGQVWNLEFDLQGGIIFSPRPDAMLNVGSIYTPTITKQGVRLERQALTMTRNAGSSALTQYVAILQEKSVIQDDPNRHLLRAGMALEEKIMADGGYPTWTRPSIWTQVILLPGMNPTDFDTVRASTLLGDMAGCP